MHLRRSTAATNVSVTCGFPQGALCRECFVAGAMGQTRYRSKKKY
jgi:hypothetical protein